MKNDVSYPEAQFNRICRSTYGRLLPKGRKNSHRLITSNAKPKGRKNSQCWKKRITQVPLLCVTYCRSATMRVANSRLLMLSNCKFGQNQGFSIPNLSSLFNFTITYPSPILLLSPCYNLATFFLPSSYYLATFFLLSSYILPSGFLEHTLNVASSYPGCTLDVPWTYLPRTLDVPCRYFVFTKRINLS